MAVALRLWQWQRLLPLPSFRPCHLLNTQLAAASVQAAAKALTQGARDTRQNAGIARRSAMVSLPTRYAVGGGNVLLAAPQTQSVAACAQCVHMSA